MTHAPELFDTHVHLDSQEFEHDRAGVIERARAAGVARFVTIGAGDGLASASRAIAIAAAHPFIWASAGVHPHDGKIPFDPGALETLASHPRIVAIGETGLDFHYNFSTPEDQVRWFIAQIEIARHARKPLIIHCREAAAQCFDILVQHGARDVGGVFHCYSEDAEFARKLRDINFLISMPGMVTFKKADNIRAAVREIPLDQLMLETDGPFLAPVPFRGKRCESAYMLETAKAIADLKGISLEDLARATTKNALKFFKIEDGVQ